MAKKIMYSEPGDYFPKEIRDEIFGTGKSGAKKKKTTTAKKSASTGKKKVKRK